MDPAKKLQNFWAGIICNDYDYINTGGIDLIKSYTFQFVSVEIIFCVP